MTCGHGAYANVISEMQRARLYCKQYSKDGDKKFDAEVVTSIKDSHTGKKKLMRMLDSEFGRTSPPLI